jgi:hypothetical protein
MRAQWVERWSAKAGILLSMLKRVVCRAKRILQKLRTAVHTTQRRMSMLTHKVDSFNSVIIDRTTLPDDELVFGKSLESSSRLVLSVWLANRASVPNTMWFLVFFGMFFVVLWEIPTKSPPTLFAASLASWNQSGKKGVWLSIPIQKSHFIPIAVEVCCLVFRLSIVLCFVLTQPCEI